MRGVRRAGYHESRSDHDEQQETPSMGRFAGGVLAVLLVPAGVSAGLIDYPADLMVWVVAQPPKIGDEGRWLAANNDTTHQWVVFLRGDRPSVRLRVDNRGKGSPYPER